MSLYTGIKAYWRMDGAATDPFGGFNGTVTNVTFTTAGGKINQGAVFGGVGSKIEVGLNNPETANWTISAWIYITNYTLPNVIVHGMGAVACGFYTSATTGTLTFWDGATNFTSTGVIPLNTWTHVVLVEDGDLPRIYFYINGVLDPSDYLVGVPYAVRRMGTDLGTANNFAGYLDEVGWWYRAFSLSDVTELYNGGAGTQLYPAYDVKFWDQATAPIQVGPGVRWGPGLTFNSVTQVIPAATGSAPVISNFSPDVGSLIFSTTPISFNVTDDLGIRKAAILAKFPAGQTYEVIHDGTTFGYRYNTDSIRTVISGGYNFIVHREGGWPSSPTIVPIVVDVSGSTL